MNQGIKMTYKNSEQIKQEVQRYTELEADSFADKYAPFRDYVQKIEKRDRRTLIKAVEGVFHQDNYAGLGLVIYGPIPELANRLESLLASGDDCLVALAIGGIGLLNAKQYRNRLKKFKKTQFSREVNLALKRLNS